MPIEKSHVMGGKNDKARVVEENPFVDIRTPAGNLIAQNGKVMHPGGEICDPVPDWFWESWKSINPILKKRINLKDDPNPEPDTKAEARAKAKADTKLEPFKPEFEPKASAPKTEAKAAPKVTFTPAPTKPLADASPDAPVRTVPTDHTRVETKVEPHDKLHPITGGPSTRTDVKK